MASPTRSPAMFPTFTPSRSPSATPTLPNFPSSPVSVNTPSVQTTPRPSFAGSEGYGIFSTFSGSGCDPASLLVQEIDAFGPCFQVLNRYTGVANSSYLQLYFPGSNPSQGTIKIFLYSDTACRGVPRVRSQPSSPPAITQGACIANDGSGNSLPDPNGGSSSYTYSTFTFSPGLDTPPALVPLGLQFTSFSTPCSSAAGPDVYQTVAASWAYPPNACFVDAPTGHSGRWTCSAGEPYFYLTVYDSKTCCVGGSASSRCRSITQPYGFDTCNVAQERQIDSRYLYMYETCNTVPGNPVLNLKSAKPSFGPEQVTGLGIALSVFLLMGFLCARLRARRAAANNVGPRADEYNGDIPAAEATISFTPTATLDERCPPEGAQVATATAAVVSRLTGKGPPVAEAVPTAYTAVATETRASRMSPLRSFGRNSLTLELPVVGTVSAAEPGARGGGGFRAGADAAVEGRQSLHQV